MERYAEALDKASDRALMWKIGRSEEGRDMIVLAIADEATITQLDKYKGMLAALTDPRTTTEERAREIIGTAKPIYWITSGLHSGETGGPEMLQELAYRLIVEDTPFVQQIATTSSPSLRRSSRSTGARSTSTPTTTGRRQASSGRRSRTGQVCRPRRQPRWHGPDAPAHEERDEGPGRWKPTVMHDLHEAQAYLYTSTGTGPYNEQLDPITIGEWWLLAETEVMEMAKRGVPGVWTWGFYDGWVPNYMFFIAHTHNAIGRFYEVQSYGPDPYEVRPNTSTTSREWYRRTRRSSRSRGDHATTPTSRSRPS